MDLSLPRLLQNEGQSDADDINNCSGNNLEIITCVDSSNVVKMTMVLW